MHYTAMYGMRFRRRCRRRRITMATGWRPRRRCSRWSSRCCASSSRRVSCCRWCRTRGGERLPRCGRAGSPASGCRRNPHASRRLAPRLRAGPLGGIGQPPRAAPAPRLPVEGADGTHFIDAADISSVRADAHYTKVHDGTRERMCPWSISEAEAQLDPGLFVRVHRSHIVAIPHVASSARRAMAP